MNLAATLIVIVLAVGGPHGAKPSVLKNAYITVFKPIGCGPAPPAEHCDPPGPKRVRESHDGRLTAKLAPGEYFVDASLARSNWPTCGGNTRVALTSAKTTRVTLHCSVK
jgi:hypothetical protein